MGVVLEATPKEGQSPQAQGSYGLEMAAMFTIFERVSSRQQLHVCFTKTNIATDAPKL